MPELENEKALFADFAPATATDWERKVQQDLKGDNPASLYWQTPENLTIKPCYHPQDRAGNSLADALPGQFPWVRGHKTSTNQWENTVQITAQAAGHAAIAQGAQALAHGADALHLVVTDPTAFDLALLIKDIDLTKYPVSFTVTRQPAVFAQNLLAQLHQQNIPLSLMQGYICYLPADSAEKYTPGYFDELKDLLLTGQKSPDFSFLALNSVYVAAAGGTITQEIALTISAAVATMDELTKRGLDPATVARNIQFRLAVGTHYFFEIAKLRALRLLWANVLQAYGLDPELAGALRLHSETSRWYQTTFDPHSNLLRATTQAMAAVVGSCDSLIVWPFDVTIRPENEFSERLARNLSLILKEEAYLHQSIDPAAGSYYLETLTDQLADEAWRAFQELEKKGGFIKAWQSNDIADTLQEVAQQKFKNIAAGTDVLVGTNKFVNPQEKIDYDPEELIQSSYFDTTRAAYPFEVMRFAVEMHYRKRQQKPKAIVASIGEAIQRHINATFAQEFFTCAGFITENQHFASVAEAELALQEVSANIIVMSVSEREFDLFSRHFSPALRTHKDQPALVLAANPQHMREELKAQGFDEFMFQGCDTAAIIARIQERLLPKD
ncbi:MAG: Methylmalonyl-CoA mutase small subunit, MutA [uncultured Adhaeribacter sp.]|uniref:Methylmalonyl-CoA mutase small subunit, MutA n=1 Tax=uncultured Adhaeribacter sp. TaxID=448109 RepID=A0A6J4HS47_9BACT|nr:MAG: Methylmalonyl-CoA mutase small subunit, MutA [uncultured Adhaeribacter sp.]